VTDFRISIFDWETQTGTLSSGCARERWPRGPDRRITVDDNLEPIWPQKAQEGSLFGGNLPRANKRTHGCVGTPIFVTLCGKWIGESSTARAEGLM
jgi:hypothetical protein